MSTGGDRGRTIALGAGAGLVFGAAFGEVVDAVDDGLAKRFSVRHDRQEERFERGGDEGLGEHGTVDG